MARRTMLFVVTAIVLLAAAVPLRAQLEEKSVTLTESSKYYKGRMDVTGWKPGEDYIYLRPYYVPWQGQDSLDYELTLQELKINGKKVGVNLVGSEVEPADKEGILSVQCDPAHLDALAAYPDLVALSLVGITNEEDLAKLANLSGLQALDLAYCKITDAGAAYLASLTELRALNLSNTEISDEGLKNLAALENLRELDLTGTWVSDAGLAYLKDLDNLRTLNLYQTRPDGEALALRGKPLDVTDAGLKAIAGMGKLSELNLHGAAITDQGVKDLATVSQQAMVPIRKLDLSATDITDECVPALEKMTELRNLDIKGTNITPPKVAELRTKLPECAIIY